MSNCSSHRLAELAVGLALLLLVALVIVLWTGSTGATIPERNASVIAAEARKQQPIFSRDLLQHVESEASSSSGASIEQDVAASSRWRDDEPTWSHWKGDILPNGGTGDSEHIVLAKANQNSYEDPLDEHSKAERHHSGHFRHIQNKVWDPHPQYEFTAFGRNFHLSLKEDSSFAPPGVSVTHISDNVTRREYPDHHLGCFYSGFVDGDPKSNVAVSLCHGMTGHMRTSTGNYLIKPTELGPVGSPLQHIIYRLSKADLAGGLSSNRTANDLPDIVESTATTHECGLIDNDTKETSEVSTVIEDEVHGRRRRRHVTYPRDDDGDDKR